MRGAASGSRRRDHGPDAWSQATSHRAGPPWMPDAPRPTRSFLVRRRDRPRGLHPGRPARRRGGAVRAGYRHSPRPPPRSVSAALPVRSRRCSVPMPAAVAGLTAATGGRFLAMAGGVLIHDADGLLVGAVRRRRFVAGERRAIRTGRHRGWVVSKASRSAPFGICCSPRQPAQPPETSTRMPFCARSRPPAWMVQGAEPCHDGRFVVARSSSPPGGNPLFNETRDIPRARKAGVDM